MSQKNRKARLCCNQFSYKRKGTMDDDFKYMYEKAIEGRMGRLIISKEKRINK